MASAPVLAWPMGATTPPAGVQFYPGLTVLASYFGAENFGHHPTDNWNVFLVLRDMGLGAMRDKERTFSSLPSQLLLSQLS